VRWIGLFAFGSGLLFLSIALVTNILNSMAKRRYAIESFEAFFLELVAYCMAGMAVASFMLSLWLVRS